MQKKVICCNHFLIHVVSHVFTGARHVDHGALFNILNQVRDRATSPVRLFVEYAEVDAFPCLSNASEGRLGHCLRPV